MTEDFLNDRKNELEEQRNVESSTSHQFAIRASEWAMENLGPEPGWEKAHTPLPEGMCDTWVWLPHDLHQIHGLLQSEDVGRCCFFSGETKPFLLSRFCSGWFDLMDLYDKWTGDNGRKKKIDLNTMFKAGKTGKTWEITSPQGQVFVTNRLVEWCTEKDLNPSLLRQTAHGLRNHHKGFTASILQTKHT